MGASKKEAKTGLLTPVATMWAAGDIFTREFVVRDKLQSESTVYASVYFLGWGRAHFHTGRFVYSVALFNYSIKIGRAHV